VAYLKAAWKGAHVRTWDQGGWVKGVFTALGLTDAYSLRDVAVVATQVHGKYSLPSSYLTLMLHFAQF